MGVTIMEMGEQAFYETQKQEFLIRRVSVVGLGKLGSSFAVALASRGFHVNGVDVNDRIIESLKRRKAPFYEPGLQELLDTVEIDVSKDISSVMDTDATFIIVPTPSEPDGSFSAKYLISALEPLAEALRNKSDFHVISVVSTVSPGTTRKLIDLVERISGKKCGVDFGFCYNPTFIALGSVIKNFLEPDLVLIGESDQKSGESLEKFYRKVVLNSPRIVRMSIPSAEITKIALNSFITMKISFANTLAEICERVPGANIDDITLALGADRRVSPYYIKGGLAYGGPCFPRDNKAFAHFARSVGVEPYLAVATDMVNQHQIKRFSDMVLKALDKENGGVRKVSVLGLSYKPGTPVIEESPSVRLVFELLKRGVEVCVWDPRAMDEAKNTFGERVLYACGPEEALSYSKVWIFATAHEEFLGIEPSRDIIVFDPWRILVNFRGRVKKYFAIGLCQEI